MVRRPPDRAAADRTRPRSSACCALSPTWPGAAVLDVACGQGLATRALARPAPATWSAPTSPTRWSTSPDATPFRRRCGHHLRRGRRPDSCWPFEDSSLRRRRPASSASWTSPTSRRRSARSTGCSGPTAGSSSSSGTRASWCPRRHATAGPDGRPAVSVHRLLRRALLAIDEPRGRAPGGQPPPHAEHRTSTARPGRASTSTTSTSRWPSDRLVDQQAALPARSRSSSPRGSPAGLTDSRRGG